MNLENSYFKNDLKDSSSYTIVYLKDSNNKYGLYVQNKKTKQIYSKHPMKNNDACYRQIYVLEKQDEEYRLKLLKNKYDPIFKKIERKKNVLETFDKSLNSDLNVATSDIMN